MLLNLQSPVLANNLLVQLASEYFEDEGCPHLIFNTLANVCPQQLKLNTQLEITELVFQTFVFTTAADGFAIDGCILPVTLNFQTSELDLEPNLVNIIEKIKTKLKLALFEKAENSEFNSEEESQIFSNCLKGSIDVNAVPVLENTTRALKLFDEALAHSKIVSLLESIFQHKNKGI